ncbi:uncharacterized protein LOC120358586 [Solenopsis invicta]|uniref:uncharacterized protein LOC120358586 n=1 Tax=Solenopsis invicta TaxID=13686 RepID=UPI00193E80F2|nr:uncharacterized protein LOC120358586 [Solenopsis invicta]
MKLPTLELPKFDGTQAQWLSFRDTFQTLIDSNTSLEKIQKFHYLKSCLQGSAAEVVQSLDVSTDNYSIAWALLRERFENKKLLIHQHIHALLGMGSIIKESPAQLRRLVDETTKQRSISEY